MLTRLTGAIAGIMMDSSSQTMTTIPGLITTKDDHDERCHGPIDTAENREMYLEAFKWECCDEPGDAEGCQRGAHRASESVEKSGGPVEDYESTEEEDDDEEEEEVEARNKKDEDPEVVIVGERQVVNKRKADDSFEVSVYAQKTKRGW